MKDLYHRSRNVFDREGLFGLFSRVPSLMFGVISPYLPQSRKRCAYNGVTINKPAPLGAHRLPHSVTHRADGNRPDYEGPYVRLLTECLEAGDDVVVVGGGWGVSTVRAARCVGSSGSVVTFEGGRESAEKTRNTVELNDVGEIVKVNHAIVSEGYSLRGQGINADVVEPQSLPKADALLLDCDGAEVEILESLSEPPEKIVVEHHNVVENGERIVEYQPELIRDLLQTLGYSTIREEVYDHTTEGVLYIYAEK